MRCTPKYSLRLAIWGGLLLAWHCRTEDEDPIIIIDLEPSITLADPEDPRIRVQCETTERLAYGHLAFLVFLSFHASASLA